MSQASATPNRYNLARVQRYLQSVEAAYGISIKFWLRLGEGTGGVPVILLYAWGSGEAFDLIPSGIQPRGVTVDGEEVNSLGEALYWSICFVAMLIDKVKEPIGPRLSL